MEGLNALEITKIAMDMEKEGQAFYRKAAVIAGDEKSSSMFILLAEQEKRHSEMFYDLHELISQKNQSSDEYLYDENVSLYMKALVENKVFKENEQDSIRTMNSIQDALRIGINSEKNSILFYNEIMRNTKSADVLGILALILEQEKKHLLDLTGLLNTF